MKIRGFLLILCLLLICYLGKKSVEGYENEKDELRYGKHRDRQKRCLMKIMNKQKSKTSSRHHKPHHGCHKPHRRPHHKPHHGCHKPHHITSHITDANLIVNVINVNITNHITSHITNHITDANLIVNVIKKSILITLTIH